MEYQDIIKELYGKLPDYLESQGIQINDQGFFSCIHPDHPDNNPSCSINKGNAAFEDKVFHCFSGNGHDGNIFTAAHWLEKMPLDGLHFWEVTVKTLCERYDLPYTDIQLDEDTKRKYQAFRGHTDAARVMHTMAFEGEKLRDNHIGIRHLLDRGITEESIKEWNIGILTAYKDYTDAIKKLGHTDEEFLHTNALLTKNIFNRDSFIIPIEDLKNQVVGFVSRNCRHAPNEHINQKYINSPATQIYTKGEILFGYNKVRKEKGPLYIVEGYLDAILLRQAGLKKVAAIGATVLTEHHVDLLFDNETDVILCLDGDKGGEDGTKLAIERLAKYSRFNLKIVDLPNSYDPDSYIRDFGLDKFLSLEKTTPFAWSLKHSSYSDDMTAVAQKIIPTIAAETSAIARLRMIKELSQFTAISNIDIKGDVDALVNKEDDKYVQELRDINQYVQMQLSRRKVSDTKAIIKEAYNKIDIINDKYNSQKDLKMEHFHKLESLENKIKDGDYKYGLYAPNFPQFEEALDGIPYWANLGFFAGRPSAGKTAFMTALSLDIIEANDDSAIFYMSIDDNMDLLSTKMLAVRSGLTTSQIRQYSDLNSNDKDRFVEAMDFMKNISDRYIIADSTQGNSIDVLENHVRWFCKEYPNQKKIFLLDNFHKLHMDMRGSKQKNDAISETSSRIKDIADLNDINIMSTVELRKLQRETSRPTRQDMQGSNRLDYDAQFIGLIHNDYQVNPDTRILHETEFNGTLQSMPYIEVNLAKNKINGRTAQLAYEYNKYNMQFVEGSTREWKKLLKETPVNSLSF